MNCPQCNSVETRSFEMAYTANTSSGTFAAGGFTLGAGATLAAGKIKQQSGLAARVQPPSPPRLAQFFHVWLYSLAIILVVVAISGWAATLFDPLLSTPLAGFVIGVPTVIAVLIFPLMLHRRAKTNNQKLGEIYEHALERWKSSWICLRCGYTWIR